MPITVQNALRPLSYRNQIGAFLNSLGLTGKGVEVGTLHGAYSAEILKTWKGHLHCVDPWINQPDSVYFDSANKLNMEQVFAHVSAGIGRNPRCTLLRMMSLVAAGRFEDGELEIVYLDGNHEVGAVRSDIMAWWPKVKVGGILSGHDCNTRYDHETNSDAATAVMELCEVLQVRPHLTWCTSWWILKTEELDRKFREANLAGLFVRHDYTDNRNLDVAVVLPVARFDWNLAVKFLTWWAKILNGRPNPFTTIAWCSPDLTAEQRDALGDSNLPNLALVVAKDVKEMGYYGSPNQVFKGALEYCERELPGRAPLWAEADTVPMRSTWVEEILEEYRACGRPFMGDIHRNSAVPHMTGNAVYHPNWRTLAPAIAALGSEATGWDSLCAHDLLPRAHAAKTIQQIWRPPLPITEAWTAKNIRTSTALFHQCKDGSLIDVLCAERGLAAIPLAKPLCESTYVTDRPKLVAENARRSLVFRAPESAPAPQNASQSFRQSKASGAGRVHILITSCKRDAEFTTYLLQSINRFAKGFAGTTLLIPTADARYFRNTSPSVRVKLFDEVAGKGFLHHMVQVCRADEICPDADHIVHVDPDCMFWESTTPEDLIPGGRCPIVREHYDIVGPRQANRLAWRECVENATGIRPTHDMMVRHPQVYPRALYGRLRQVVEAHTGKPFNSYVLDGQNKFPQTFCEYISLGSVGLRDFPDSFSVVDYDFEKDCLDFGVTTRRHQYIYKPGRDKLVEGYSYNVAAYRNDWTKFLRGVRPAFYVK